MIFAYWTGSAAIRADFIEFWSAHVPGFRVFSDDDVIPLIKRRYPELYVPYTSIRVPSCKSDVARLILLEEFGGLYVDAHTGCRNFGDLVSMLSDCGNFELGLVDAVWAHQRPGDVHLLNGAIYARKESSCINALVGKVKSNILDHYILEKYNAEDSSYNITVLTGAWNFRLLFFKVHPGSGDVVLQDEFKANVLVVPFSQDERSPLQFYQYYQYRSPGTHWSERQKNERLFDNVIKQIV